MDSGTTPVRPLSDSIAPFTEPLEAAVVTVAHSAVDGMPKRCSLPSRLKPWIPAARIAGEPLDSAA
jgi:hypothetical protein